MSPESRIRARAPAAERAPEPVTDPSILEAYNEDASSSAPGTSAGLLRPEEEASVAAWLRETADSGIPVLPQAARSSLTGGAVPEGEVVISVERLDRIGPVEPRPGGARVTVGAGIRLVGLQEELADAGFYYPPVPTYQEAMIGGTVSTNAGGPATFKYGVTRHWIHGIRVVLFNGDLLELERGMCTAPRGGAFTVELSGGTELRVPVPSYELPPLKKISAGYFSSDPLDLVDLFVGSEGTLGLVTAVTVDLVPLPPAVVTGLAFVGDPDGAVPLAAELREAARKSREAGDTLGPDVRAIEFMDLRCLEMLRAQGETGRLRVQVPEDASSAILFEMELPERIDGDGTVELLEAFLGDGPAPPDGPLVRLFGILERAGVLETLQFAFPDDDARREKLMEFREAAPKQVNEILGARRRSTEGIKKVGGDLIVPFDEVEDMLRIYERGFEDRGLEYAIWGHLSDGNLHPNALPRDAAEVIAAEKAVLEFAEEAVKRGGCPLSEHGVGRSPLKQKLLRNFLGEEALDQMRAVKRALDPAGRFAPGILFPAS